MIPFEYFSDEKYKYSTALMFSYIHLCKPLQQKTTIDTLLFNLEYPCWENNIRPIDVLQDMKNKKYKDEIKRINKADMTFPIVLDSKNNIID